MLCACNSGSLFGSNPRFLEQVIAFLRENENYIEDFNLCGPLTPVGLDEILKETRSQEIFKIVLRRLRNAPEGVQEALQRDNGVVESCYQLNMGLFILKYFRKERANSSTVGFVVLCSGKNRE